MLTLYFLNHLPSLIVFFFFLLSPTLSCPLSLPSPQFSPSLFPDVSSQFNSTPSCHCDLLFTFYFFFLLVVVIPPFFPPQLFLVTVVLLSQLIPSRFLIPPISLPLIYRLFLHVHRTFPKPPRPVLFPLLLLPFLSSFLLLSPP